MPIGFPERRLSPPICGAVSSASLSPMLSWLSVCQASMQFRHFVNEAGQILLKWLTQLASEFSICLLSSSQIDVGFTVIRELETSSSRPVSDSVDLVSRRIS